MALVQAKCTNCGANIEVDQTKEAGICPYCNTAYITQKAIINYNSTIINNYSINADTVNITGPNFDNLMKSAMSAFDGGNFSAAEEKFSRALEITPDSVEAISSLKGIYAKFMVNRDTGKTKIVFDNYPIYKLQRNKDKLINCENIFYSSDKKLRVSQNISFDTKEKFDDVALALGQLDLV